MNEELQVHWFEIAWEDDYYEALEDLENYQWQEVE